MELRKKVLSFFLTFSNLLNDIHIVAYRTILIMGYDLSSIFLSWFTTCWLLLSLISHIGVIDVILYRPFLLTLLWIMPLQFLVFKKINLYRGFWRFSSIHDLNKILISSLVGGLLVGLILNGNQTGTIDKSNIAPTIIIFSRYISSCLYVIFLVLFLSFGRFIVRLLRDYKQSYGEHERVIIVGAGNAGEGLVRDLLRNYNHRFKPIAFVDDDVKKIGRQIHNIRVMGNVFDLPQLIRKHRVDLVIIAIPSAVSANIRAIMSLVEQTNVRCYTLPTIRDLANGLININTIRSISLEDLLGRYPVRCSMDNVNRDLSGKTILVTGGGGSIGSELCRQILMLENIKKLIILDNNEYNLYSIEMELKKANQSCVFYPILTNVTDKIGLELIFNEFKPDIVFHAAAYKHVPLLEYQPRSAIYNNLIGTCMLAEVSIRANVGKFVLISSDKAVNPTNVMGATKRGAEYFCQNINTENTKFITVRFGNVLDSAGSVIPLFRNQIEMGGPLTVTHPEITRYFMTIPEASQLILQATSLGMGGEIFVLDMGEPIKIRYLAEQMIRLAGKVIDQDIKIVYTGLRPGEKLFEEYFYSSEKLESTINNKILIAQSQYRDFSEIKSIFLKIKMLCESIDIDIKNLIHLLKKLVPEYKNIPSFISEVERQSVEM